MKKRCLIKTLSRTKRKALPNMLRRMAMLKLLALKEFHWRKLLNKILQTKKRLKIFQPLFFWLKVKLIISIIISKNSTEETYFGFNKNPHKSKEADSSISQPLSFCGELIAITPLAISLLSFFLQRKLWPCTFRILDDRDSIEFCWTWEILPPPFGLEDHIPPLFQ